MLILIGLALALAGVGGPETPIAAVIVGLFLGDAVPPPPWRDGLADADRAIEAGAAALAAAFPLLVALGAGPWAPLRGALGAVGVCVAVRLVAMTVESIDMRMTSTRVRHHAVR